jgi:cyclase
MTLTRRGFLGATLAGLAAGSFGRAFASERRLAVAPASGRQAAGAFVDLRRNVGIFTLRGGTIGWLVNPAGALVVDSQYADSAGACVAGLDARRARSVDALVNTHHHADHTGGNGVFRDAAARRIVAHHRVPGLQRMAAAASGTAAVQVVADTTFDDEWSIEIGDETVRAKHGGAAHTGGDCTVSFEQADVVHMGDLVFNRAYPFIDRPGGASIAGWITTLERVAAEHTADTLYVFGHGNPAFGVTGGRPDVLVQRDFLAALLDVAHRGVAAGWSREESSALASLPGFPDHVALGASLTLAAALRVAWDEASTGG